MNIIKTAIEGVDILTPKTYTDNRGEFCEVCSHDTLSTYFPRGIKQISQSKSHKGVARGLHFQDTVPMGKLIRCVEGEIVLYNVDLRIDSPTFTKTVEVILNPQNSRQVWAPGWCARGFYALQDSIVEYYHDAFHISECAMTIAWDDPFLNILWPNDDPILSDKDQQGMSMQEWFRTPESRQFKVPNLEKHNAV